MANNVQYTIGFNADTSQAKKALQELSSAFAKLEKKQLSLNYNDLDLNKAVESAKELQIELNKATNINTGKLNLNDFVSNLSQSKSSLKELSMNLISAGKEGQQAFASLANSIAQAEVPLKQTNTVLKNFTQTLKNTVKWEISSNIVHGLESALSGAVSYVKNLNSSLNDIRIVTGYSADDMTRFAQQANKAAKELSTTTKAYTDASLIYFQQGDSAEMVAKKAAITTKAANVAFSASAEEMSEMLTAVWNSYQVGEAELEKYVDIMAALGAATATSTEEIATAMQKVAATANTVGVSMEQMSSIIATVASVTREAPESIGTSFKTILARMGDLKVGKTLEDGMSLGTVSSQLAAVGVNILDTTGELKDMGGVIEELMGKWQGMTSAEKTAIAQAVAGKRQYTQLMALMENQDMYKESMNIAGSAKGTLQKQVDIYTESWQAASDRMQASFEALYSKIINDKALITFADGISKITDSVSSLIDAFGGLPGLLATIGAVATKVFSNQINANLTKTIGNISTYFKQFSSTKDFINKIGHGKTKTTAELRDEQARNQANQIFADLRNKVPDGSSEAYTIDSAKQLLAYKQQLVDVESQLNDAEKQSALTAMDSLSQQQQAVANLLAEKEELFKESKTERDTGVRAVAQSVDGAESISVKRTKIDEEIAADATLLQMVGKRDDGTAVTLTEDVTSLNQLLEMEQAQSKMANLAMSFKSQIKQIQDASEDSADVISDTIKRINSALGIEIPENSTIDELIQQLDEIQQKAEATQDDLEEILDLAFTDGSKAKTEVFEHFNGAAERGAEQAELEFSIQANENSVEKLKGKLEEALNPESETYSKIATGLTKATGYAQNLVSSFSTGTNLVATMSDETATLGDKISAVAGGISSLASGFMSGGWIGLAISAVGMLISGLIQAQKEARKAYEESIRTKAEKSQDRVSELERQNNAISQLLPKYGELAGTITSSAQINAEYKSAVQELTDSLGFQGDTIDGLINKYGSLDQAITQGTITQLENTTNDYEIARQNLIAAAALQLGKNGNNGIFEVDDNKYILNGSITTQAAINTQNAANNFNQDDEKTPMSKHEKIMTDIVLLSSQNPEFQKELLEMIKNSWTDLNNHEDFNFDLLYRQIYTKAQTIFNTEDWSMDSTLSSRIDDLYAFIEFFDMAFGDPKNNLGKVSVQGGESVPSFQYLFGRKTDPSNTADMFGDYAGSLLEEKATNANFLNYDERDTSDGWFNLANEYANTWKDILQNDTGGSDEALIVLNKLRSNAEVTAQELYDLYIDLTDLSKDYPELKNDSFYQALDSEFSSIVEQVSTPLDEAQATLDLIHNGFTISNFKAADIESLTDLKNFISKLYETMGGEINGKPVDIAKFTENAIELLKMWGLVPEITTQLDNQMSVSASIAERNHTSQTKVLEAMDQVRDQVDQGNSKITSNDLNWSNLVFKNGEFTQESIDKEIAFEEIIKKQQSTATEMAGIKTLQGYSRDKIQELGQEGFDKLGITFDESIPGFENVKDFTSYMTLLEDEQQEYLTAYLQALENKYYEDGGILDDAADAEEQMSEYLSQLYNDAINSDAYADAKKAVAEVDNVKNNTEKLLAGRTTIAKDKIPEALKQILGENWSSFITEQDINDWLNADDNSVASTQFVQKLNDNLILRTNNVSDQRSYLTWLDGILSNSQAYANSANGLRQDKNWNSIFSVPVIDEKENSIKVLTSNIQQLETEINALNAIDVTKMPKNGTAAYKALNKALTEAGKGISDYQKMSKNQRVHQIGEMQRSLLEKEKTAQDQIIGLYAERYGFNEDTTDYATILEGGNKIQIAEYEKWSAAVLKKHQLEEDIVNSFQSESEQIIQLGAQNTNAVIALFENEQEKLKKAAEDLLTAADILSANVDSGVLTFEEQSKIDPNVLNTWKSYNNMADRVAFVAQQTADAYKKQMEYQQNINDGYKSAQSFMSEQDLPSNKELSDSALYSSSDVFKNYLNDLEISDAGKAALIEADSKVRSTLGNDATVKDWGDAMRTELKALGKEGTEAFNLLEAQGKDTLSNIFLNFSQEMRDKAEEAVQAWIQAFKDISDAKQKLLSGGNLIEDIAGDPSKLIEYANALGIDITEASQKILSGTVKASDLNRPSFDLNANLAQYGLDLTSYFGTGFGKFNVEQDREAVLKSSGVNFLSALFNKNQQEAAEKTLQDLYKNILTDAKMANEDGKPMSEEQIDKTIKDIFSGDQSAYQILITAVNRLQAAAIGSTEALIAVADTNEAQTKILEGANIEKQSADMYGQKTNYNDLQKLSAAIGRAQEAKNNNQGFDELSSEDQSLLTSYGIDFTNVDSAAIDCANALTACAEAALNFALTTAKNQGYYKNSNGNYQLALSEDEYVQRAKAADPNADETAIRSQWKTLSANSNVEKTQDGKVFIGGTESSEITSAIQGLEDTLSGLKSTSETKFTENLNTMAASVDMTKDEFIQYTKAMVEAGEITATNTEGQYKQAQSLARVQKGLKTVRDNSKTWSKALKDNAGDAIKCNKTLSEMRSAFEDVLDVPVGSLNDLSEEFMTSAETADLLEKAMDGDIDAYNELQAKVAEQILIGENVTLSPKLQNAISTIATEMDNLPVNQPIAFGELATVSPQLYAALNDYVAAIAAAGGDVEAAAAALGFDLQYEEKELPAKIPGITYTAGASVYDPATKMTYTNITPHDNGTSVTWTGLAIKAITNKGTHGGNIGGHKSKGSGGGGGGGKAKKIDKKDPEDEKERYHHVNKVLERLSNQLDEIDKKKSRVYGKSYLDYISQEIALTEKQCDTYQRYIDEAKEYLALDTQRVASLGATFDEFGNIENYDQVMDNIMGKYNEFVDRYNAMSASEQTAAEEEKTKWDKWYEEKKKWIENYEETVSTIYDQQNNLLEAQNKISEKTLEGIQYKVEIHVDMTEAEKDFLDYLNDTYDGLLEKQGDVMNNLVRETELATSNLDALGQSKEELDAAFASGKLNQADYVEGLKDVNEQILDNLGNIQDLKKEIEELYGNTLEMASDAFDTQTEKVKNASEAMSSYISILGLIGKGSNLKDLTKFYDSQYEYNLQSLEMQKEYLDILRSEEQYYLDRMNSAEGLTETERQQYEDLEKTIADVNSNILSDTESTLNQIAEAFNNEIEIIFKDLEERIAGVGNSVQDLADAYQYYQEEQSRYVTSAKELYEVNKLNRQIEKTMNETSSKINKNLLAALQDRINKQSELNELTEYDIEMNQLQYELLLKKIALEEAQNAKSTVRLTRDSGGNYVYQYTADQDDIMTKQQEYEDVLQQINDLSVNRVQDLESQLLEIYQNTLSKIKEIAQDQTLTEEEKYDKIQTIMNQFKEQTNFIQEQYQIASDNLITSNLAISEHYGQQLVEHSENAKNGLNQTIAAMIQDTEGLQQALEDVCANKIPAAMDTMQSRIDAVTAAVNLDYNTMSESVNTYNKVTKDAQDQTNETANSLNKDLLPAIHSATTAWDTYMGKLKNVISTYESMYQSILKTIQAQAKLSNATAPSTVKSSGTGKFSDTTTPSATGNTDTGSGDGGGDSGGRTGAGGEYTTITYKVLTTAGPAQGKAIGGSPSGPKKLAVGSTGTFSHNPSPGFVMGGWSISDPSKLSISGKIVTALAAGSVVVTVKYWDRRGGSTTTGGSGGGGLKNQVMFKYATGGLADFTGPAWLDGSKSKPEMVLNAKDTENILTAVQGVRALDASTLSMLNKYITNASLAMSFGLGNISAGSVYGTTDTIQQEVHITAEFPNATNSAEIQDAFDNIINRATQYITTKR